MDSRLLCFPHAGAGAGAFRSLAHGLRPGTELWAVQYPAREDRSTEDPARSITDIADNIGYALQWLNDLPCAFLGHSMGAVVAYETARRTRRMGMQNPFRVFVSACESPQAFARQGISADEVGDVVRRLDRDGALPTESDVREMAVTVLEDDLRLIGAYEHDARLDCPVPITACVGGQDPDVRPADMMKWREFTSAPFDLETFPGDHLYLLARPPEVNEAITGRIVADLRDRG
ncbi:thioesterase II family protein [Spirillospora sp. NPDC127200]